MNRFFGAALLNFAFSSAHADNPVRTTLFVMPHPGVDDGLLMPALREIEESLKRNARLEMKDLATRLAEFAQEIPQQQMDEARQLSEDGRKDLNNLDLPKAIKKLNAAVDALGRVLPFIKKQELADAMMALGAAQFAEGDRRAARVTFVRLFTWRSDYRVDIQKYAPPLLPYLEEARREVQQARRGSIEIVSQPPAAQAYVDGRYVGITPCPVEGLVVGEHWVTLKRDGYLKAVRSAVVSPRSQESITLTLERSKKFLLVEQTLAGLQKSVGTPTIDNAVDNLREVLFIDHAVFVAAAPQGGGARLSLYLYDLRSHKKIGEAQQNISPGGSNKELAEVTSSLYKQVRYDGIEIPRDAPPPKKKVRQPLYKTWWFWTVTIGAVAVVSIAGGVGWKLSPETCTGGYCTGDYTKAFP